MITSAVMRSRAWHRIVATPGATRAAATVLLAIALVALLAPVISPHDPNDADIGSAMLGPSSGHWLGTDASGRDLLSRLIWGSRSAILGPLVVVAIAGSIGIVLAVIAAWHGGWVDTLISRILDVIFSFPGILLALVAVAVLGSRLSSAVAALSIAYIPYVARVVRSEAVRQRSLPFIRAGEINGFSGPRIALRHLLPNIGPLIMGQLSLSFGYATVDLAAISYLGLGVQAPSSDWGLMVATGQSSILRDAPQESIFAGVMLVVVVVAVTVLGDHLSHRLERESQ